MPIAPMDDVGGPSVSGPHPDLNERSSALSRIRSAFAGARSWEARRIAGGGIGAATVARTVGVVAVSAALANAYILPPDQRSGSLLPVVVESFSATIDELGAVGVLGETPRIVPGGEDEPEAGTWTLTPMDGWQVGLGSLIAVGGGDQVPRTLVASTGVRLSAVEARLVIPAAWSGIAFRASGPNNFWAAVADPNPLFLRLVRVEQDQVQTVGRFRVSGGLFDANVRIELGSTITVKVNGRVVGRVADGYLADYRANAGLVILDKDAVGATFDDLVLWATQADIASARASGLDDSSAFGNLPSDGGSERSEIIAKLDSLTPEQRRQLETLTPEQVEQMKDLAG